MKVLQKGIFYLFLLIVFCLFIGPILVLTEGLSAKSDEAWHFFVESEAKDVLIDTVLFSVGTVFVSLVLGVFSAYVTEFYEFKGRRFFSWALILPLAMPAYILGFIYLGLFEPTGYINDFLKSFEIPFRSPHVKNMAGGVLFKAFTLYPYIYLLARTAFASQSRHLVEAAHLAGASHLRIIFKVVLPLAWPWLFGGMALVFMEALSDFGMVKLFDIETLTTAIYSKWISEQSLPAAERVSFLLLALIALFYFIRSYVSGNKKSYISVKEGLNYTTRKRPSVKISTLWFLMLLSLFAVTFLLPMTLLIVWAWKDFHQSSLQEWTSFLPYGLHSLVLSLSSAFIIIAITFIVAVIARIEKKKWINTGVRISSMGYALPGTLLGVAVYSFLLNSERLFGLSNFLTASIFGLILGYSIRFYAVGNENISNGFERIAPSLDESAFLCGKSRFEILSFIHLPLLKTSLLVGFILLFVDIMKELPLTLIMRPYGWDTLPIRVYNYSDEGEWVKAAFPALLLVIIGAIPILFVSKFSDHKRVS